MISITNEDASMQHKSTPTNTNKNHGTQINKNDILNKHPGYISRSYPINQSDCEWPEKVSITEDSMYSGIVTTKRVVNIDNRGVDIGRGICTGVVTKMILEDKLDNDNKPFFTKQSCLEAKHYQHQHNSGSLFSSPTNNTKKMLEKNGKQVTRDSYLDTNEHLTTKKLDSIQHQTETDNKKRSVFIGKTKLRNTIGHATFFSVEKISDNQTLCTGMDPNIAVIRGYNEAGCRDVKDFLVAPHKRDTGYVYTQLLIALPQEAIKQTKLADLMLPAFSKPF